MSGKKKRITWIILAAICFSVFVFSCIMIFITTHGDNFTPDDYKITDPTAHSETTQPSSESTEQTEPTQPTQPEPGLADNPIDFAKLQGENEDIYAWIIVPGTPIDYPVVRHPTDSEYYLRRDYRGNNSIYGCVFSQFYNKKDFSDPNTVFYGHYVSDGTYFGSLHDFRDPDFFNKNTDIIVYTLGRKLTYQIFSAYEYSDAHLLTSVNYIDEESRREYFDSCLNPRSMYQNVREGATLDLDDKIITLSTCLQNSEPGRRYLVQGVLVKDEKTK